MASSVQDLVNEVRSVVDVSEDDALREFNRRHRLMYARANPYQFPQPGDALITAPSTDVYVPEDLRSALVDGTVATFLTRQGEGDPATLERRFDAATEELARRLRETPPARALGAQMVAQIRNALPGLSQAEVLTELNARYLQAWRLAHPRSPTVVPPTITEATTAIDMPAEFRPVLVDATMATFLRRQGQGDPDALERRFFAAAEEWRRQARRATYGYGPDTIQIVL